METVAITITPCHSNSCFCAAQIAPGSRLIYGKITSLVGYDLIDTRIELTVPSTSDELEIYCAMENESRKFARSQGAKEGYVQFRKDGSNKGLSAREWLQQIKFILTGRGTPVVRKCTFSLVVNGNRWANWD
jgi:hypothetical protein